MLHLSMPRTSTSSLASARGFSTSTWPRCVAPSSRLSTPADTHREQTFLIFSSLVYERKDALVDQAINLLKRDPLKRDEARAEQLIFESEALIRDQVGGT